MKKQIEALRKAVDSTEIPRDKFKNRPVGCPFYKNMNPAIQQNFTQEESYKAFYLGKIGNNNRKGTIIENALA